MSVLSEKLRKAREFVKSVGGFDFTNRRPTDMDMLEFNKARNPSSLVKFVVGWDKVKELDLIPGGEGHPAPFDPDACAEWLSDRSDLFVPLVSAIIDAFQAHKAKVEDAEKN